MKVLLIICFIMHNIFVWGQTKHELSADPNDIFSNAAMFHADFHHHSSAHSNFYIHDSNQPHLQFLRQDRIKETNLPHPSSLSNLVAQTGNDSSLTYNIIQLIKKPCFPMDSCERPDLSFQPISGRGQDGRTQYDGDNFMASSYGSFPPSQTKLKNCECDNQCIMYGDCCIDFQTVPSPHHDKTSVSTEASIKQAKDFNCRHVTGLYDVYMIDRCSPVTIATTLRHMPFHLLNLLRAKCEDEQVLAEAFTFIPYTDANTNITYRNVYCGLCNVPELYSNEELAIHLDNLIPWSSTISCDFDTESSNDKINDNNFLSKYLNPNTSQLSYDRYGKYLVWKVNRTLVEALSFKGSNNIYPTQNLQGKQGGNTCWWRFEHPAMKLVTSTRDRRQNYLADSNFPSNQNEKRTIIGIRKCVPSVIYSCSASVVQISRENLIQNNMNPQYVDNMLADVNQLCLAYTGRVWSAKGKVYRNAHCALCNNGTALEAYITMQIIKNQTSRDNKLFYVTSGNAKANDMYTNFVTDELSCYDIFSSPSPIDNKRYKYSNDARFARFTYAFEPKRFMKLNFGPFTSRSSLNENQKKQHCSEWPGTIYDPFTKLCKPLNICPLGWGYKTDPKIFLNNNDGTPLYCVELDRNTILQIIKDKNIQVTADDILLYTPKEQAKTTVMTTKALLDAKLILPNIKNVFGQNIPCMQSDQLQKVLGSTQNTMHSTKSLVNSEQLSQEPFLKLPFTVWEPGSYSLVPGESTLRSDRDSVKQIYDSDLYVEYPQISLSMDLIQTQQIFYHTRQSIIRLNASDYYFYNFDPSSRNIAVSNPINTVTPDPQFDMSEHNNKVLLSFLSLSAQDIAKMKKSPGHGRTKRRIPNNSNTLNPDTDTVYVCKETLLKYAQDPESQSHFQRHNAKLRAEKHFICRRKRTITYLALILACCLFAITLILYTLRRVLSKSKYRNNSLANKNQLNQDASHTYKIAEKSLTHERNKIKPSLNTNTVLLWVHTLENLLCAGLMLIAMLYFYGSERYINPSNHPDSGQKSNFNGTTDYIKFPPHTFIDEYTNNDSLVTAVQNNDPEFIFQTNELDDLNYPSSLRKRSLPQDISDKMNITTFDNDLYTASLFPSCGDEITMVKTGYLYNRYIKLLTSQFSLYLLQPLIIYLLFSQAFWLIAYGLNHFYLAYRRFKFSQHDDNGVNVSTAINYNKYYGKPVTPQKLHGKSSNNIPHLLPPGRNEDTACEQEKMLTYINQLYVGNNFNNNNNNHIITSNRNVLTNDQKVKCINDDNDDDLYGFDNAFGTTHKTYNVWNSALIAHKPWIRCVSLQLCVWILALFVTTLFYMISNYHHYDANNVSSNLTSYLFTAPENSGLWNDTFNPSLKRRGLDSQYSINNYLDNDPANSLCMDQCYCLPPLNSLFIIPYLLPVIICSTLLAILLVSLSHRINRQLHKQNFSNTPNITSKNGAYTSSNNEKDSRSVSSSTGSYQNNTTVDDTLNSYDRNSVERGKVQGKVSKAKTLLVAEADDCISSNSNNSEQYTSATSSGEPNQNDKSTELLTTNRDNRPLSPSTSHSARHIFANFKKHLCEWFSIKGQHLKTNNRAMITQSNHDFVLAIVLILLTFLQYILFMANGDGKLNFIAKSSIKQSCSVFWMLFLVFLNIKGLILFAWCLSQYMVKRGPPYISSDSLINNIVVKKDDASYTKPLDYNPLASKRTYNVQQYQKQFLDLNRQTNLPEILGYHKNSNISHTSRSDQKNIKPHKRRLFANMHADNNLDPKSNVCLLSRAPRPQSGAGIGVLALRNTGIDYNNNNNSITNLYRKDNPSSYNQKRTLNHNLNSLAPFTHVNENQYIKKFLTPNYVNRTNNKNYDTNATTPNRNEGGYQALPYSASAFRHAHTPSADKFMELALEAERAKLHSVRDIEIV